MSYGLYLPSCRDFNIIPLAYIIFRFTEILRLDKQEWQDAIKRDTLNWEQVCDFGGLNSEVAKQYAIKQVPSNILLSADGKILAKNLKGEQLKKKIEEVVTAAEEKEKQDNKKKK